MNIYASFVRNIVYPLVILKNRSQELNYLKKFEKSQFLSLSEIRDMQLRKLKKLIEHAYQNCNYYRKLMDKIGMVPEDIKALYGDKRRWSLPFNYSRFIAWRLMAWKK